MPKNKDIFGVQRDKTVVAMPPAPQSAPDTGDETVGARMRPTRVLKKRIVKRTPMFSLEVERKRVPVEKIEAPEEMPANQVEAPKQELKKKEEE